MIIFKTWEAPGSSPQHRGSLGLLSRCWQIQGQSIQKMHLSDLIGEEVLHAYFLLCRECERCKTVNPPTNAHKIVSRLIKSMVQQTLMELRFPLVRDNNGNGLRLQIAGENVAINCSSTPALLTHTSRDLVNTAAIFGLVEDTGVSVDTTP